MISNAVVGVYFEGVVEFRHYFRIIVYIDVLGDYAFVLYQRDPVVVLKIVV
jgi:hypothetical protein